MSDQTEVETPKTKKLYAVHSAMMLKAVEAENFADACTEAIRLYGLDHGGVVDPMTMAPFIRIVTQGEPERIVSKTEAFYSAAMAFGDADAALMAFYLLT